MLTTIFGFIKDAKAQVGIYQQPGHFLQNCIILV